MEESTSNEKKSISTEKDPTFIEVFKIRKGYIVTPIIMYMNLLAFLLILILGGNIIENNADLLIAIGANTRLKTIDGEWWRLITSVFLHNGIMHLLVNIYAFYFIGDILESYIGKTRFLFAYLFTGIVAGLTSVWWYDLVVSVGASGAIFGLYGVYLALLTSKIIDKSIKKTEIISIIVFVLYNLIYGLLPIENIDNAAHIGGFLSGIIIGYAIVPSLKRINNNALKYSSLAVLSGLLILFFYIIYNNIPNELAQYDKKLNKFFEIEEKSLELIKFSENDTKDEILSKINQGINYWKEGIILIDSLQKLKLPETLKEQTIKLKEYTELRIKSYELIYKATNEGTNEYDSLLDEYIKNIDLKLEEIKKLWDNENKEK